MKNTQVVAALFASPSKAFAELNERPRVWFPLLWTVVATIVVTIWYYALVDFSWLVEETLSGNPDTAHLTDAQRQQAAAFMSRSVMMATAVIGTVFFFVGARLLEAVYYLLAGNITGVRKPFKNWFALGWWTGLPSLVGILAAAPILLLSDNNQISSGTLSPLSLNEIFFHKGMAEPGFTLLTSVTLIHPIIWGLTIVAVRVWSGRSWWFSILFSMLPVLLVYGAWAAFAFR